MIIKEEKKVSPNFGFILGAFQGNEEMRATIS